MGVSGEKVGLSIVIPVFNAESTLKELTERLRAVLSKLERTFEIVLVNDGSADASWNVMCALKNQHGSEFVVIDLMRNFGQHNAIMCGLRECSGEYVVTMDDDLQNAPEDIEKLVNAIDNGGLDVVYGCYKTKKHALWRNMGSLLTQKFYRSIFKRNNCVSAFRIVRRNVVESIILYDKNFTYIDGLIAWVTNRVGQVEVDHFTRTSGRSGYSLQKLLSLALNLFTNFSLVPLQVVSALGLFVAMGGVIAGLYYILQVLMNNISVPGYASIIIAVLILGGVQLLSLGVLGEYLGRVHLNINEKPQYVSREIRR